MRSSLFLILFLAGCSTGTGGIGGFLNLPRNALTDPAENAIYTARRGEVELIVKSAFDTIISDIQSGGGPTLTQAFDAAGIPPEERATRAFQLNSDLRLYAGNPGALVSAIMLYSSG